MAQRKRRHFTPEQKADAVQIVRPTDFHSVLPVAPRSFRAPRPACVR